MHTFEENFVCNVQSEVHSVITTVETRVQDTVLTAKENLMIPRVEFIMKSAKALSRRSLDGNVLEVDQRDFSGRADGLQLTTSSRMNSHSDLRKSMRLLVIIL